jgi:hypothetical protein
MSGPPSTRVQNWEKGAKLDEESVWSMHDCPLMMNRKYAPGLIVLAVPFSTTQLYGEYTIDGLSILKSVEASSFALVTLSCATKYKITTLMCIVRAFRASAAFELVACLLQKFLFILLGQLFIYLCLYLIPM